MAKHVLVPSFYNKGLLLFGLFFRITFIVGLYGLGVLSDMLLLLPSLLDQLLVVALMTVIEPNLVVQVAQVLGSHLLP